jgi:NodT family efflux transporter outer membrane factor (OMF) lipoprotein
VHYADIHGSDQPLDVTALSTPHVYRASAAQPADWHWWDRFHNPQLHQLITTALIDSPTIHLVKARVRQARHLAQETQARLWPSVTANGEVYRERFSTFGLIPPPFNGHTFNIGDLGLNFNYEFDWWGKNRQMLASRLNETKAREADLAAARLMLSTLVATTYFQLQNNMTQLKIARDLLQQHQDMLTITKNRVQHGIESDIPVGQLLAETQNIKITVTQLNQREILLRHQLAVLLGKSPFTTKIHVAKRHYQEQQVALPDDLPANLLAQRPDIAASRLRVESAANQIHVAKTRFFPNINLMGLFSYQGVGLNHVFQSASRNTLYGAAIDLPFFDAGARRAHLAVTYAEYDQAVSFYNQTILVALREVADQLSTLRAIKVQQQAQGEAFRATRRNYHLTYSRYQHGIIDYVQLLSSRGSFLQQQAQQTEWQTRRLQAVVAMIKALGGGVKGHDEY